MMILFTILVSVVNCVQPLYSTSFQDLDSNRKQKIQQNYTLRRSEEDPETFDAFVSETAQCTEQLALLAVKERNDMNLLEEQDKAQLAKNVSEIMLQ